MNYRYSRLPELDLVVLQTPRWCREGGSAGLAGGAAGVLTRLRNFFIVHITACTSFS